MKKLLTLLLVLILSMGIFGTVVNVSAEDELPTVTISTGNEFIAFVKDVNEGKYSDGVNAVLTADLDLSYTQNVSGQTSYESVGYDDGYGDFTLTSPIGIDEKHPFKGTFDGQGYSIEYWFDCDGYALDGYGLFGVNYGTIKNLTVGIKDAGHFYFWGYNQRLNAGGLCATNYGKIENCVNHANIIADRNAGGICATNYGTVDGCDNYGGVNGYYRAGGIVGTNKGIVINCLNYGSLVADSGEDNTGTGEFVNYSGGIVGELDGGKVYNCANYGKLEQSRYGTPAGIVGRADGGEISACFVGGSLLGKNARTVVGLNNDATVTDVYYEIKDGFPTDDNAEAFEKELIQNGYVIFLLKEAGKDIDGVKEWLQNDDSYPAFTGETVLPFVSQYVSYLLDENGVCSIYGEGEVPANAFENNNDIKEVTFADGIEEIGSAAFAHCENIEKIDLSNVKSIGANAFEGCKNLTEVVTGETLSSVSYRAFKDCISLINIDFCNDINIDNYCFEGCSSLNKINLNGHKLYSKAYAFKGITDAGAFTVDFGNNTGNNSGVSIYGAGADPVYMGVLNDLSNKKVDVISNTLEIRSSSSCVVNSIIIHRFDATKDVKKAATCIETGLNTHTCGVCGEKLVEVLPAIGHKFTNKAIGLTTNQLTCSVCKNLISCNTYDTTEDGLFDYTLEFIGAEHIICEFESSGYIRFYDKNGKVAYDYTDYSGYTAVSGSVIRFSNVASTNQKTVKIKKIIPLYHGEYTSVIIERKVCTDTRTIGYTIFRPDYGVDYVELPYGSTDIHNFDENHFCSVCGAYDYESATKGKQPCVNGHMNVSQNGVCEDCGRLITLSELQYVQGQKYDNTIKFPGASKIRVQLVPFKVCDSKLAGKNDDFRINIYNGNGDVVRSLSHKSDDSEFYMEVGGNKVRIESNNAKYKFQIKGIVPVYPDNHVTCYFSDMFVDGDQRLSGHYGHNYMFDKDGVLKCVDCGKEANCVENTPFPNYVWYDCTFPFAESFQVNKRFNKCTNFTMHLNDKEWFQYHMEETCEDFGGSFSGNKLHYDIAMSYIYGVSEGEGRLIESWMCPHYPGEKNHTHTYNKGKYVLFKNPTCTESGYGVYTCDDCGYCYFEKIEALGHTVIECDIPATCTQQGIYVKYCTTCRTVLEQKTTAATNEHKYTKVGTNAATDCLDKQDVYRCTTCNFCNEQAVANATKGHVFDKNGVCIHCHATNTECYSNLHVTGCGNWSRVITFENAHNITVNVKWVEDTWYGLIIYDGNGKEIKKIWRGSCYKSKDVSVVVPGNQVRLKYIGFKSFDISSIVPGYEHVCNQNGKCTICGKTFSLGNFNLADYSMGEVGYDKTIKFDGASSITVQFAELNNDEHLHVYDGKGNEVATASWHWNNLTNGAVTVSGDTVRITYPVGSLGACFVLGSVTPNYPMDKTPITPEQTSGGNTGSVLSDGNLWIIIVVAVVVVGGITGLVIIKKKKKPVTANDTTKNGSDDE